MKTRYVENVKVSHNIAVIKGKTDAPLKINTFSSNAKAKTKVITPLLKGNLKKVKSFNSKFEVNTSFVPTYHHYGITGQTVMILKI